MIATYSPCEGDDPDLIVHRHASGGGSGGSATRIIYLQEAQTMGEFKEGDPQREIADADFKGTGDERLVPGVSENGCVVWSAPDSPEVGEARECEAYANPLDGGWGGYRAECHACKWTANRRDEKGVAQADALHRANQTCPWRQGHERVIPEPDAESVTWSNPARQWKRERDEARAELAALRAERVIPAELHVAGMVAAVQAERERWAKDLRAWIEAQRDKPGGRETTLRRLSAWLATRGTE